MMEVTKFLFCLFCSVLLVDAADLPKYFTKCKKSDPKLLNECILKNIVDNWQTFIKGDNTIHLQKMTPLVVPFMQVRVDANLYGNLTNGNMFGYELTEFRDVKFDLDKKEVQILSLWPKSSIVGTYDVVGKLIGLSIADTGSTNVTFINGLNRYIFRYELKEKKGKQHIQMVYSNVKNEEAERIYFDMNFNRNKQLGETVNRVLNENWEEVAEQVRESVGETLGVLMKALLQPFFDKVSFDDFFAVE